MTNPERLFSPPRGGSLYYRCLGSGQPLLMLAGMGLDMYFWPHALLSGLSDAGFELILPDNRDAGRSDHGASSAPSWLRLLCGTTRPGDYALTDMAQEMIALMDHLGHSQFHVLGFSLGGMIAQEIACLAPERVRGLTSISSTTRARQIGGQSFAALRALLRRPPRTQDQYVTYLTRIMRVIAGDAYPLDEDATSAYAVAAWDRCASRPEPRLKRQISAIRKSGDRSARLARVTAATLVVHGDPDRMVATSGGRATASAIAGGDLRIIEGMGHTIPAEIVPDLIDGILQTQGGA